MRCCDCGIEWIDCPGEWGREFKTGCPNRMCNPRMSEDGRGLYWKAFQKGDNNGTTNT